MRHRFPGYLNRPCEYTFYKRPNITSTSAILREIKTEELAKVLPFSASNDKVIWQLQFPVTFSISILVEVFQKYIPSHGWQ